MKQRATIFVGLTLAWALGLSAGCGSSSSTDSTPKIDGMTPAEYREKAELSRESAKRAPTAKGPSRRR